MMIECDTDIIRKGLALLAEKSYDEALKTFEDARNFYGENNASGYLSVSLSLFGLAMYLKDKSRYEEVLSILNDAQFMAENSKSDTGRIVNEYAKSVSKHISPETVHRITLAIPVIVSLHTYHHIFYFITILCYVQALIYFFNKKIDVAY